MKFNFNSAVAYYVNIKGIQVHDKGNGRIIELYYPEAAVFDLMIKKLPEDKIIRMLSIIFPDRSAEAEKIFNDTLKLFIRHNIVIKV